MSTESESEKFTLVDKLKLISEGLLNEPNVRYRPCEEVTAELIEAFNTLDRIREFEKDRDAVDIQEETSWDDRKIRKRKIRKFLDWLKSNGVNTDNIKIEFNEELSRYKVLTRKSFPVDKEIFRIPSNIIFSCEITFQGDAISLEQAVKEPVVQTEVSLLAESIAVMYNRDHRPDLKVYFDMLPRIKAYTHPMCFSKDEVLKIQNFDNLFCDSVLAIARIMRDYSNMSLQCHDMLDRVTFRRYLWARLTVDIFSTTVFRTNHNGTLRSIKTSLVPLLDMCRFQRAEKHFVDLKYDEGDVDDYVCISLQKIPPGSPITRNYANPSYYACFSDYGFVPYIFDSGLETYRLALELSPISDNHFDRRARILKTLGFSDKELFDIQQQDLKDCRSKPSNIAMRLFLYCNVIRGNTALLDLIERNEGDLTFLTKPTRMTWLYLAIKFRIKLNLLRNSIGDLFTAIDKETQRKSLETVLSVRVTVIFLYVMTEFNCIRVLEKVIRKQIEALGPDKPEIKDEFDSAEDDLRKLYETSLYLQSDNSQVEVVEHYFKALCSHHPSY